MPKLKLVLLIIGAMTMLVCSSYKRDRATIIRFYDADPDEYFLKSASPKPKK